MHPAAAPSCGAGRCLCQLTAGVARVANGRVGNKGRQQLEQHNRQAWHAVMKHLVPCTCCSCWAQPRSTLSWTPVLSQPTRKMQCCDATASVAAATSDALTAARCACGPSLAFSTAGDVHLHQHQWRRWWQEQGNAGGDALHMRGALMQRIDWPSRALQDVGQLADAFGQMLP